jgi:GAF domain-containing protein
MGVGIVGEVAAAGGAELVEDASTDPRATAAERAGGSLVVAALRAGDAVLGVVGATSTGGPFRSADLKVVTAIAALAGPAIGRALGAAPGTDPGAATELGVGTERGAATELGVGTERGAAR